VTREQRKLAAILAADVVGYSRLTGRDEGGTLARFPSATEQRFHLFQDRINAKSRPGSGRVCYWG
jgi:class 3 adenylate cyclase